MEGDELEKLIQDTLDRLDEQYSEARVVHNELYIRCKTDSQAPLTSSIIRKMGDPEGLKRIIIEDEDTGETKQYENW